MLNFLRQRLFGPKKANHRGQSIRLTLEEFESRFLPNAGPLSGALNPLGFGGPLQMGAPPGGFSGPSSMGQDQTHALSATLTGATGTSGSASFSGNPAAGTNTLNVQVSGLTASTSYNVAIGGTTVGQISTDANGSGQLSASNLSSKVTPGSTLTVLDSTGATVLSGTFAATGCSSGPGSGSSTPGGLSSNLPGATSSGLGNMAGQIATDASTFVTDLQSGDIAGALAALNDFESYLSSIQSLPLQELQALMFLDQVFADLASS